MNARTEPFTVQPSRPSTGSFLSGSPWIDVLVAMVAIGAAAAVAFMLPDGSTVRWALALPIVLIAPGYLLLQAIFVPAQTVASRLIHALVSLGVSPAIVGLAALSTAPFGAFREGVIVAVVTGTCLVFGMIALVRRGYVGAHRGPDGRPQRAETEA